MNHGERGAVAGLLLLCTVAACHKEVHAAVECNWGGAALAGDVVCSLEHRAGDVALHACWDIHVKCQNGVTGVAHGCGDVDPQGKSTIIVPFSAFGGSLDKCDAVASSNVTMDQPTRVSP
jgi:hypothetical protein